MEVMIIKVTKNTLKYPENQQPDLIVPAEYESYRFCIGKKGVNPLLAICMNPSAAKEDKSDRTINRIIHISQELNYDGWVVFNIYPERATNAININGYDQGLESKNLRCIKSYIEKNKITEVWGAWGDLNYEALIISKENMISLFKELGIKIFYFGSLTVSGNPRHPLQRYEKWENIHSHKKYLEL